VNVDADRIPLRAVVGVTSNRARSLTQPARAVHQAVLRGFATTGAPPDRATLAEAVPAGYELAVLLRELHDWDVVRVDDHGEIRAAYPFSAVPFAHTVAVADGPTVWAMCAIDALGIADMVSRDVTIASTDPANDEPIRVRVTGGRAAWEPDTAVVIDGADPCAGDFGDSECADGSTAAADRCCGVMNFFASSATAEAWLATHPTVTGVVLTQEQALRTGFDIFGTLLDD
jgi:hypothetical protein